MSFKMTLVGAALTLSMAPLAARADDYSQPQQPYSQYGEPTYAQPQYNQQYQQPQYQQPGIAVGEPYSTDRHGDRPGRYEQRTVQRWVPAQYRQVWVAEQCTLRERQRGWWRQAAQVCVPAHYEQRWVPAHQESVQQWVWVPFGGRHYGRWGHPDYGRRF